MANKNDILSKNKFRNSTHFKHMVKNFLSEYECSHVFWIKGKNYIHDFFLRSYTS